MHILLRSNIVNIIGMDAHITQVKYSQDYTYG